MRKALLGSMILALGLTIAAVSRADDYKIDTGHAGATFKISHLGLSWTYGRFNDVFGEFRLDAANPANNAFAFNLKTESIDTNNKQRDDHLRSPDFFNAKQFPLITFKSAAVKAIDGGFEVTGVMNMLNKENSITFPLKGGKMMAGKDGQKTGFTADFTVKRSDFGMTKGVPDIGDDVIVSISFEGSKK